MFMGVVLMGWFIYNQFYPTPEFQRSFRSVFQLIVPIVFLKYGWRWIRYEGPGIEETPADFTCRELIESVKQAKDALPYFLNQVRNNIDGSLVKFPIKTPQGLTEHIWGYVHSYQDGKFNVSLANKPTDPNEAERDRRNISIDEIEDWEIMQPSGQVKGSYSLIALFRYRENQGKKLSPKMRKQKARLIDAQPS
jgi:uncharacterized protein YegJ (DUF2314 family)